MPEATISRGLRSRSRCGLQLEALHGAGREVLDEYVGGLDQVEQRLATGVGLQVQHDAAFVGVEHHELVGLDRLV